MNKALLLSALILLSSLSYGHEMREGGWLRDRRSWEALDEAVLAAFPAESIISLSRRFQEANGPIRFGAPYKKCEDFALRIVFLCNKDGKPRSIEVSYPDIPEYQAVSRQQWRLFKRILKRKVRVSTLSPGDTPIRYSRYYYTEWYPDLERHLKDGWPVDHYLMDLNGPDILDYSKFERSPWTESPMEATVFEQERQQDRVLVACKGQTALFPASGTDAGAFSPADPALKEQCCRLIQESFSLEDFYVFFRTAVIAPLGSWDVSKLFDLPGLALDIHFILDLKSGRPHAVAFTYEGYKTCYNTTPDLWERFEQVLHRKVRIPRRGDAKEGNMLSCTVSLSLRDCYEIGCQMNPEHK